MLSTLRRSTLRTPLTRRTIYSLTHRPIRSFSTTQPEHHSFKAETRRLLDIVANSLYTDKEVFIRELISNASDALEKLRFLQTTDRLPLPVDHPLKITLTVDPVSNSLTIRDSGVGMTKDELLTNLGTIAKSGTSDFRSTSPSSSLIGRFGVGFYSSFVVADRVEVISRSALAADAPVHRWSSDGHGTFTLAAEDAADFGPGTQITLHLKEDCANFAKAKNVKALVEKFSSFVDFPVFLATQSKAVSQPQVETSEPQKAHEAASTEASNEATATGTQVNTQEPLYQKTSATSDEHTAFFQYLTDSAYAEPHYGFLYHTDAPLAIKAALYVVAQAPAGPGGPGGAGEGGIRLYSRRVLVQKEAQQLLPQWMSPWVRGAVDCEDGVGLNVSREHMQDSRLIGKLGQALVRKILRFLGDEGRKDRARYDEFFSKCGGYLKNGLLDDARTNNGGNKDLISKLLKFHVLKPVPTGSIGSSSGATSTMMSLEEFSDSIEGDVLYYVVAPDVKTAEKSPYVERLAKEGFNALVFTEEIDEYLANYLGIFKGKRLVNVAAADVAAEAASNATGEDEMKMEKLVKSVLSEDLVDKVVMSGTLKSAPAVVTSQISGNMRKMMRQMIRDSGGPGEAGLLDGIPVTLELNPTHPVVKGIMALEEETAKVAIKQLFHNSLIAAGLVENPQILLGDLHKTLETLVASKRL